MLNKYNKNKNKRIEINKAIDSGIEQCDLEMDNLINSCLKSSGDNSKVCDTPNETYNKVSFERKILPKPTYTANRNDLQSVASVYDNTEQSNNTNDDIINENIDHNNDYDNDDYDNDDMYYDTESDNDKIFIPKAIKRCCVIMALIIIPCLGISIIKSDKPFSVDNAVVDTVTNVDITTVAETSVPETTIVNDVTNYVDYEDISEENLEQLRLKDPPFEINDESESVIKDSIEILKSALQCDMYIADKGINNNPETFNELKNMYSVFMSDVEEFNSISCDDKDYNKYHAVMSDTYAIYDNYIKTVIEFCNTSPTDEEYTKFINEYINTVAEELGDISWVFTEYSDIFYFYGLYE